MNRRRPSKPPGCRSSSGLIRSSRSERGVLLGDALDVLLDCLGRGWRTLLLRCSIPQQPELVSSSMRERMAAAEDFDQVELLFDESRDPADRIRDSDWHPSSSSKVRHLDHYDTVAVRRNWYVALKELGKA